MREQKIKKILVPMRLLYYIKLHVMKRRSFGYDDVMVGDAVVFVINEFENILNH